MKKAFPSREYLAKAYHQVPQDSARIYFYYPVRMKDLFFRYGYTLWRLFRRDAEIVPLVELGEQPACPQRLALVALRALPSTPVFWATLEMKKARTRWHLSCGLFRWSEQKLRGKVKMSLSLAAL